MPSTAPTPSPDLAQPAALAAFLRGVERRAAVFAELQCGDASVGDAALTRAMAAFRDAAVDRPMAEWPREFWSALLDQPALRRAAHARPPAFVPACSTAVRAAILLRLAAGLDEATAAAVLGVAPEQVRRAVVGALPAGADGRADAAAWVRLQGEVQARVRGLALERGLRLARMHEAALAGPADRFFHRRPRSLPRLPLAGAVAASMALAIAGTFWLERRADPTIRVVPLARAGEPASRYTATSGLIAHPDFDLLADPAEARLSRDAAFLAWFAGHAAAAPDAVVPADAAAPEAPLGAGETGEANDAP